VEKKDKRVLYPARELRSLARLRCSAFRDPSGYRESAAKEKRSAVIGYSFKFSDDNYSGTSFLDQSTDFSLVGESLGPLLGIDKLTVTPDIKNASASFDQLYTGIGIFSLHFGFHTGSIRVITSTGTVCDRDLHKPLLDSGWPRGQCCPGFIRL
jgi:hypothetical protein